MVELLTPAFWVAVSFFIFVLLAWKFIRNAFLKIINEYRNSIASNLNNVKSAKGESLVRLEASEKELEEAKSNEYILNAHKLAKEILEKSSLKIKEIESYGKGVVEDATLVFKNNLQKKVQEDVLAKTATAVKAYLLQNKEKFTQLSIKKATEVLKNERN